MDLNLAEGVRPDVDLILQGVGSANLPPLAFDPDTDPVLFTHHPNWNIPGLAIVPLGVVFRAWRTGRPAPVLVPTPSFLDGERDPRVPKDYLTQNLIGHFHYMRGVAFEDRDWPKARAEFETAAAASPDNDVLFFNLGLIYSRNGLLEDALSAFRRCDEINPRHIASRDRPRATDKIGEIEKENARLAALERSLSSDASLRSQAVGSSGWHRRMADLLAARSERVAARGHLCRAADATAGGDSP